eukprot:1366712-Amorphochlora_amoeboformis.AAC.1
MRLLLLREEIILGEPLRELLADEALDEFLDDLRDPARDPVLDPARDRDDARLPLLKRFDFENENPRFLALRLLVPVPSALSVRDFDRLPRPAVVDLRRVLDAPGRLFRLGVPARDLVRTGRVGVDLLVRLVLRPSARSSAFSFRTST